MFEDVRDLYNAAILERGRRPRHMGKLEAFDTSAKGDNPMCGDRVTVWLKFAPDGTIGQTGFDARGCEISKASADLMVEAVQGRSPADTKAMFERFRTMAQSGECPSCAAFAPLKPLAAVHASPSRVKCATLPGHALVAALDGAANATSES
jgi:nitrogen fixation NifU-like protein